MSKIIALLVALLLLLPGIGAAEPSDYLIQAGDVLSIDVWGYDEFHSKDAANPGITVRPDGKIAFPLAGEIVAAGLTSGVLTDNLTSAIGEYIKNPKVTVNILKYHTTRIYVLGEVNRPGLYEVDKQHNLLDAIGIAGGYTKNAAKKNVFVIRKNRSSEQPAKVNLLDLLHKGDLSQNCLLNDGDVVYLTDNGRVNFQTDIAPLISAAYFISEMHKD